MKRIIIFLIGLILAVGIVLWLGLQNARGFYQHESYSWCKKYCKPTITPTPTVEEKHEVVEEKVSDGLASDPNATKPPVCSDGTTTQVPANLHVLRSGEEATVNFFITEGDSANIYWRVLGSADWQYALSDVRPNGDKYISYTIHNLDASLGYEFGIQQKKGCGGGQLVTAVVVDGPISTLFPLTYWEWSK